MKLPDGDSALVLKDKNGKMVRAYAPGKEEYKNIWTCYCWNYPLKEFSSRDAVFKDAYRLAEPDICIYEPHKEHDHGS